MKINILLVLVCCIGLNAVAQENNFFTKKYENSKPNMELGIGYLINPSNEDYGLTYQIASRNILLYERLGFMYSLEPSSSETSDIFGVNYRFSKDFSLQAGTGLFFNSLFDSNDDGARKKLSIAYHPNYMPLSITAGYSFDMGPTIGINYRVFFNSKKKKTIKNNTKVVDKVNNKINNNSFSEISKNTSSNNLNKSKQLVTDKNANNGNNIVKKKIKLESQSNKIDSVTITNINNKVDQKINNNQIVQPKIPINNEIKKDLIVNTEKQKVKAKEIKKPTVNIQKLCSESKVLYEKNMFEITDKEKNNLKKISKYLIDNPKSKLIIYGSADKSGSAEYNLILSEKRANSSKKYLIQLGIRSEQLKVIALGESKSQNANTELERAEARSTSFEIIEDRVK